MGSYTLDAVAGGTEMNNIDNGRKTGAPSVSLLLKYIAKSKGHVAYNTHCSESCIQLGEPPFVLHLKNDAAGQEYLFFMVRSYMDAFEKHINRHNEKIKE